MDAVKNFENNKSPTYYVGIGASAGGLEALQQFFGSMPGDTGMVFIVIQHLSPDYKSMMLELLARHTDMEILMAQNGMETRPDTVYLIPPKNNISILGGKLYLEEHKEKKALNLPIDIFLRSLAADQGKYAVSIILSGTGSDGTLGIKSIKENGGMIIVQDELSAKFDGMPKSSISTGLVDFVLPPEKMPEALMSYIKHPFIQKGTSLEKIMARDIDSLSKIILILRDYCGIDFSFYKQTTISRRLERRIMVNRFDTLEEYLLFLSESNREKETLFRELLIGVTRFFRDQEAFEMIEKNLIPALDFSKKNLRIWSAGCSTGEEVYSIAILLQDYIEKNRLTCTFKIFATDIDRYSLEIAGQGLYPESIVADVDPELLSKYFTRKENGYLIHEEIRKKVIFANHNLLKDPPFSKLDMIICRNLFIYLKPSIQKDILSMFYYSLVNHGFLFMGSSETIGDLSNSFETINPKWKLYRQKPTHKPPFGNTLYTEGRISNPKTSVQTTRKSSLKMENFSESIISTILPPSILVDESDNILQIINHASQILRYRDGRFSTNIFSNLNPDLIIHVKNILKRLKDEKGGVTVSNISHVEGLENKKLTLKGYTVSSDNIEAYLISAIVVDEEIKNQTPEGLVLNPDERYSDRLIQLEKELSEVKENLQATVEELETSNEELQSSNEELIASNEELQSTNEELQAVNEELYTVNSEYQSRIDDLTRLNNDLDNLLKSTEVGALFLDKQMRIRKITDLVYRITNLLPSDIGRPISHIAIDQFYSGFNRDLQLVAENLQSIEREIVDEKGRIWIVQIRPYRSEFNAVDGMIVTLINVSTLRQVQRNELALSEKLKAVMKIGNIAWWEWDITTGVVDFDPKKATMLGYEVEDFPTNVYKICDLIHPEDYEPTMQIMSDHLSGKTSDWNVVYRIRRKDGEYSFYHDRGAITKRDSAGNPLKLIGTVQDVTEVQKMSKSFS